MIENRRSVLLLIDLQRAFCDSDGSMAVQGRPINAMSEAARQCQALTQIARRRGRPVIWTRMMFAPDYSDGGMLTRLRPGLPKIGALRRGEPDVELSALVCAQTDDLIVDKPRYSALIGTKLADFLKENRIGRVVIGGVTTSMCVESTARDLAQRDFEVAVIEEACGDFDAGRHAASLAALAFGFARVLPLRCAPDLFGDVAFEAIA
ncbi:MAG: isochorismatase family cysteine hydrolase [Xanthobacteraceae bacterium]